MIKWIVPLSLIVQTALYCAPPHERDQDPEDWRDNEKPTLYDTEQDERERTWDHAPYRPSSDESHYYRGGDREFHQWNDAAETGTHCIDGQCHRYHKMWVPDD